MRQLLATLRQWRGYITDIEHIYATLEAHGDPSPQQVFLPLLYKHLGNQELFASNDVTTFLGAYLSARNPQLREYFLNERTQQELEGILRVLEQHCEEQP